MAGSDTWRGIDFQAAFTVTLALDVLSGEVGEVLGVDPGPHIVDYSVRAADGSLTLIGQAKTRIDPYTWPPGELVSIIRRLAAVPDSARARIEFVTDGSLSPETVSQLMPAISRAADGSAGDADWEYLGRYEISPGQQRVLARVRVLPGYDRAGTQLDIAVRRVRALRDLAAPVTDEEAERLVLVLLRVVTERGSDRGGASTLSRQEIGAIVGVDPDLVDSASAWCNELAARQRELIVSTTVSTAIVELRVERVATMPTFLQAALLSQPTVGAETFERERTRSSLDLLDDDAAIIGPAGAGKSTTLDGLRRRAAAEGLTPVLIRPVSYRGGDLPSLIRQQLSRELGVQLAPGVGALLLRQPDTVLLIDNAGSQTTPEMAQALARDVVEVRRHLQAPTVIVAARSLMAVRGYDIAAWRMATLDRETRRGIATGVIGDALVTGSLCGVLERDLPGTVDNPFLFRMALGLILQERPAANVGEIFAGFVDGLRIQAGAALDWSVAIPCLGAACAELVDSDNFSQQRWDWLVSLERTIAELRDRGISGSLTAAELTDEFEAAGLLTTYDGGGAFSLIHDSFRDWLAAQAVIGGTARLPETLSPHWRDVAGYLAEAGAEADTLLSFCGDPEVAAHAAAMEAPRLLSERGELATGAFARLSEHFAVEARGALEGMSILAQETQAGTRVLLVPSTDQDPGKAVIGAALAAGAGPLACAMAVWMEQLRGCLRGRPTVPDQIPTTAAELANAIEVRFCAQRQELVDLTSRVLPGLTERVLAHAGWTGLEGHVGHGRTDKLGLQHPFSYRYGGNAVRVAVQDRVGNNLASRTTAEFWLQGSAFDAALGALRRALTDLLDGFPGS